MTVVKRKNISSPAKKAPLRKKSKAKKTPILHVLLDHQDIHGKSNVSRDHVSFMSGYPKPSLSTYLSNYKKHGYVTFDAKTVTLTEAGRAKALETGAGQSATSCARTNKEAQESIKAKYLTGGKLVAIFDSLSDGLDHDKESIMHAINMDNKQSFATYVSTLCSKLLVERVDNNKIRLATICFPFGRPKYED
jgi:hypothetical protein